MAVLWLATLALTLLAQAGTSWLVYEKHVVAVPAFGALGLEMTDADPVNWTVGGESTAGLIYFGRVLAVDGIGVEGQRPAQVASRMTDAAGGEVLLRMREQNEGGVREVRFKRDPARAAMASAQAGSRFVLATQAIDLLVAALLIAGAVLLRLRRWGHPVAELFSFAFLLIAALGTADWWLRLDIVWVDWAIEAAWLSLFLIAIPALPSGRFLPRWTRWAMVAGPIGALAIVDNELKRWGGEVTLGLLTLALACVLFRFRYTPRGAERQRLKWASLGLTAGLLMYGAAVVIEMLLPRWAVGSPMGIAADYGWYGLERLSFVVMAAGVLVCLLDWRLNDADAAIGRSAGYAALTTGLAVVWALAGTWINKGIELVTGSGDPSLSTALSTIVALLVLSPVQARVLGWTEERFQRALVRLRSLPARLAKWQAGDDPEVVAQAALGVIVDGVGAVHAALVGPDAAGGPRVLAVHGVGVAEVEAAEGGPSFPLSYPLTDGEDVVGRLLLGPRSDGAGYTRDERAALAGIVEPLADALRLSARRAGRNAAVAEMQARLARLEAAVAPRLPAAA